MAAAGMNELFVGLLMQLHYTAWVQMGKVANPGSGNIERNLQAAKESIDLLGMLEEKTKGNLQAEEEKLLSRMLLDLRMNYVEEAKRGTPEAKEEAGQAEPETAAGEAAAPQETTTPPQADAGSSQPQGTTPSADAPPPSTSEGPEKS